MQGLWVDTHLQGWSFKSGGSPSTGARSFQRHDQPSMAKQDSLESKGVVSALVMVVGETRVILFARHHRSVSEFSEGSGKL